MHRNSLRERRRRIRPMSHTPPRRPICSTSDSWLLRYEQTPLRGIIRFAHSRQVLTGEFPFPRRHRHVAMYTILKGEKPSLVDAQEGRPRIPDSLREVIARCLDEGPPKRISVGEVLKFLEAESRRNPTLPNDSMLNGRQI